MEENCLDPVNDSLDPQDWEAMRSLMHSMVDDAVDYVANVRDRKIWQEMPDHAVDLYGKWNDDRCSGRLLGLHY
jgi:hypothetical protein